MGQMDNEDLRDALIAELARKHAAAIKTNLLAGHKQTLHDLGNDVGDQLADNDMMAQLLKASAVGPLTVGNLFRDLVQRRIDNDAELEATKEVERMEAERKSERRDTLMSGAMAYMMSAA